MTDTPELPPTLPAQAATLTTNPAPSTVITGVKELLDAGKGLGAPHQPSGLEPFIVLPQGWEKQELARRSLAPLRDHIAALVHLDDAPSFIDYVKDFRGHSTRLFCTVPDPRHLSPEGDSGLTFTAYLDYHESGRDGKPLRVAHRVQYPVPLSVEFCTWLKQNGSPLDQLKFVEFIEANALDVRLPDSATLMEMVLDFEDRKEVTFQSKIERTMGGRTLNFKEDVQNGREGKMKVPEKLELLLPIFEGGRLYAIVARLEYRTNNGTLKVTFHLQQLPNVFRQAVADLRRDIENPETGLGLTAHSGFLVNTSPTITGTQE